MVAEVGLFADDDEHVAVEVHRLGGAVILVPSLPGDVAICVDPRVAAEGRSVAVHRDDPAAVGDFDLAAGSAHRKDPYLRGIVKRLTRILSVVVVRIGVRVDCVGPREDRTR